MSLTREGDVDRTKRIVVKEDGPYVVHGNVPLVYKVQVVSEYGEPLTWRKGELLEVDETYALCRCGRSRRFPFCDGTHRAADFDGTETADSRPTVARHKIYPGSTGIVAKFDSYLCTGSGFCANRLTSIKYLILQTADTSVRSQVMAMIERCPSGALTYQLEEGQPDVEPDLPQQVAVVTEITSDGPIQKPFWVTGEVPVERADGLPLESRNRMMLCGCGRSAKKPLCDGTHRATACRHR